MDVQQPASSFPSRIITTFALLALLTGGLLSWFASAQPDGLEWSIEHITSEIGAAPTDVHQNLARLQQHIAMMPDYSLTPASNAESPAHWPSVDAGTSVAGVLGGLVTLLTVVGIGFALRPRRTRVS